MPALRLPTPGVERTRALLITGCWALGLILILAIPEWIMQQHGAGILDFEFVGTPDNATRILDEWGPEGRGAVVFSTLLDFAFILAYGSFLGLVCLAMADKLDRRGFPGLAGAGRWLAVGAVVAAGADIVENVNLLLLVWRDPVSPFPQIAFVAATVKFTIVAAVVVHFVVSVYYLNKARKQRKLEYPGRL